MLDDVDCIYRTLFKMVEGRRQNFTVIAGAQGSGKTHFALKIIEAYSEIKPCLNILPDDCEEAFEDYEEVELTQLHTLKEGIFNLFTDSADDFYQIKYDKETGLGFKDGLITIDDGRTFLSSRDNAFRKFISRRRQANIDVNFICHGLSEVPPSSSTYLTDIVIFGTGDEFDRWTIDHASKYRPIVERINKISATKNPYYYEHYKVNRGLIFHPVTGQLIA